ncbi:MAG: Unknown protein [uncultured Thiotrichaceae bacterium]|uniref:Uncharacterized protein n=1 Tax=uncultured Thiotrichaceae bacterium TaxID=298394 RepID=A0A6S6U2H2_9GAMM|nr:MAG: Unknown protein [uncultured Thiotrichaceae bacterium]
MTIFENLSKKLNLFFEKQQDKKSFRLSQENKKEHLKGESSKPFETYLAPPTFTLYLWAALPLLFIATSNMRFAIAAIVATIINYLLIHFDTFSFIKYLITGFVLLILFLLHFFAVL